MQPHPSYGHRLFVAAKNGAQVRLGGRWGILRALIPAALAALVGYVSANSFSIALLSGAIGAAGWLVMVVTWSALHAPIDEDRHVRAARDEARSVLANAITKRDERTAAGLEAFRARLDEGNVLAHSLRRVPEITGALEERNAARAAQKAEYRTRVRAWNEACRETARTYLPHREPILDSPIPPMPIPPRPLNQPRWEEILHHEVDTKIKRMAELLARFEDQSSSSAATSSRVQT